MESTYEAYRHWRVNRSFTVMIEGLPRIHLIDILAETSAVSKVYQSPATNCALYLRHPDDGRTTHVRHPANAASRR